VGHDRPWPLAHPDNPSSGRHSKPTFDPLTAREPLAVPRNRLPTPEWMLRNPARLAGADSYLDASFTRDGHTANHITLIRRIRVLAQAGQ
jgi:hypothetical protein